MAWVKNGTPNTLSGSGDALTISDLTEANFRQFLIHTIDSGGSRPTLNYDNDTGTKYAIRYSGDGGADTTQVSKTVNSFIHASSDSDNLIVAYCCNISGEEVLNMSFCCQHNATGAGNAPRRVENVWKFTDTTQITRIDLTNTDTGDFDTNSNLSCIGDGGTKVSDLANIPVNTIYEEIDTAKYKWWDGSEWKMDGTEAGIFRGIFAGGYDASNDYSGVIDYITIPTTGNATDFGDLSVTRAWAGGGSNGTRGVFMGGKNASYLNTIDYVTITTPSNATDFGNLNNNMGYANETACSDTRVVQAGGLLDGEYSEVIDYVTTATAGSASTFGVIQVQSGSSPGFRGGYGFCGLSNGTKGYFGGCRTNGGMNPSWMSITIATTGNAVDTNYDLQHSNMWGGAGASEQGGSRGIIFGGYRHTGTNASINDISYVSLPISAHAVDFGDLSAAISDGMAVVGNGRAVFSHKDLTSDISQYVTIATTGNAVDFGTLTEARSAGAGTEGF